jgi:hypothetical protein
MRYDDETESAYLAHSNYLNFNTFEEFIEENEVLFQIIREAQELLK